MLRPIFCSMRRNGSSTFCSKCSSISFTRFSMFWPIFCSIRRNGRSILRSKSCLEQPDALLEVLPDHLFEQLDPLFELFERLKGHRDATVVWQFCDTNA